MSHATVVPFDTLAFVKKLETAGMPSAQTEALSGVLQKVEESRLQELATKGDIMEMKKDLESAKVKRIKWTAGMFAAQTALIIGAMFAVMKMNQPPAPVYPIPPRPGNAPTGPALNTSALMAVTGHPTRSGPTLNNKKEVPDETSRTQTDESHINN
ncbi:MAG: hypothetical protein HQL99_14545 [Magnetococcales bacterium]|nr:hypothetical protein [Magnetococcales bacterium]